MPNYFLAFDFGLRRIGVAVGQRITSTATPLAHLTAKDGIPDWQQIADLIKQWQPEKIIVGIPLQLDDSEQELTFCARKFAHRIQERFNISVIKVDERLTTKEARATLFELGGHKAIQKGVVDSMAAKIMLEDWLRLNN